MSESKHTPGPWEAKGWRVFHSLGQWNIGVVCFTATNNKSRTPRAAADAQLISAAPDLLTALAGLEYPGEPGRYCDHAAEPCPRCEAARAAIAKARGH